MLASRRAALGSAPSSSKKKIDLKVLFVSRRDTCRGPMAETIFEHLNERYSFKPFARFDYRVQSCGLKLPHSQGHLPEQLTLRVLAENGLETLHGCRQIRVFDFSRYDYILCMERSQLATLVDMAPENKKARLYMLGDFIKGQNKEIKDPYNEDLNSFRICFEKMYIACEDFYFHINEKRL